MRILILIGSPRKNGNTELLAKAFARGARKSHQVEMISVADYQVMPCIGCNSCLHSDNHQCCQKDDMQKIYDQLLCTDMLVIASPVYFYGISAQLKTIIDRLHTPLRNQFSVRKMALLLVGAAHLPELFDSILIQYQLALKFFDLEDLGNVLVRGVKDKGEIEETTALQEAFALGLSLPS